MLCCDHVVIILLLYYHHRALAWSLQCPFAVIVLSPCYRYRHIILYNILTQLMHKNGNVEGAVHWLKLSKCFRNNFAKDTPQNLQNSTEIPMWVRLVSCLKQFLDWISSTQHNWTFGSGHQQLIINCQLFVGSNCSSEKFTGNKQFNKQKGRIKTKNTAQWTIRKLPQHRSVNHHRPWIHRK